MSTTRARAAAERAATLKEARNASLRSKEPITTRLGPIREGEVFVYRAGELAAYEDERVYRKAMGGPVDEHALAAREAA